MTLLFSLLATPIAAGAEQTDTCLQNAQTNADMRECAGATTRSAQDRMQAAIEEIERLYADKPEFLKAFRLSQKAWEVFYDAQMRMMFPARDTKASYGRNHGFCFSSYAATLYADRAEQLRAWVDGTPEGDVCSGSLRFNNEMLGE